MFPAVASATVAREREMLEFPPGLAIEDCYAAKVKVGQFNNPYGFMSAEPGVRQIMDGDAWTTCAPAYVGADGFYASAGFMDQMIGSAQREAVLEALLSDSSPTSEAPSAHHEKHVNWQCRHDELSSGLQVVGHEQMLAMRQMQMQMQMCMDMQMQLPYNHHGPWAPVAPLMIPVEEGSSDSAVVSPLRADAAAFEPCSGSPAANLAEDGDQKNIKAPRRKTGAACRSAVPSTASEVPRQVETLASCLQVLCAEDPASIFIVRRINKLGFKACRALKQHFAAHGSVVRVLSAHSSVRQHGDEQGHARRRQGSFGFVQMASAKAVQKVLALGVEHVVNGCIISVQKFERKHDDDALEKDTSFHGSPSNRETQSRKGERFFSEASASTAEGSTAGGSSPRDQGSEFGDSDA